MARWALTGGIASGKSTVGRMFSALGVPVVDADHIYHTLILPRVSSSEPSALALAVAAAFPGVLKADGHLDRQVLGAQVFADPDLRRKLEAITHPAVQAQAEAEFAAHEAAGASHVLYDVPLLYERGLHHKFQGVVLVWVPRALQQKRLIARDRLTPEQASLRLHSQMPLDDKKRLADHIIDNSTTEAHTLEQVQSIVGRLDALF